MVEQYKTETLTRFLLTNFILEQLIQPLLVLETVSALSPS